MEAKADPKLDDHFFRFKEKMTALARSLREAWLVGPESRKGEYNELCERLENDPGWILQGLSEPVVIVRPNVPQNREFIYDVEARRIFTPTQFFGDVGLGRLNWSPPSAKKGVRPWSTAKIPKGARRMQLDQTNIVRLEDE